jgi:hypothetical protein
MFSPFPVTPNAVIEGEWRHITEPQRDKNHKDKK